MGAGSSAASPSPTEASGGNVLIQFTQLICPMSLLFVFEMGLKRTFLDLGWSFPPALVGMAIIFAALAAIEATLGQEGLADVFGIFRPALTWTSRWMPLFYVPVVVTLPLAVQGIAGVELAKFSGIVCAGVVASLFFTASCAMAIRGLVNKPLKVRPSRCESLQACAVCAAPRKGDASPAAAPTGLHATRWVCVTYEHSRPSDAL